MARKAAQPLVAGIDLGGTNIQAAVVNPDNEIIGRARKKTRAERGAKEVTVRIIDCIKECLASADVNAGDIAALCIGAPGPLRPEEGIVISAPNLGWRNVPLKSLLESAVGIRTLLDNDVNIGTYGEFRLGAGRGVRDLVGIFVGTGIGGGLVIDGKLHRGFNHTAGEIGHLVVRMGGPKCGCGNRGCLEAIAGRAAIARELASRAKKRKTLLTKLAKGPLEEARSRAIADAYNEKDDLVVEVLDEAVAALGAAIGGVVNLLSPEAVILGGGLTEALGKPFVKQVAQAAAKNAFPQCIKNVRFAMAELGDDAGVLGAAQLAREAL